MTIMKTNVTASSITSRKLYDFLSVSFLVKRVTSVALFDCDAESQPERAPHELLFARAVNWTKMSFIGG